MFPWGADQPLKADAKECAQMFPAKPSMPGCDSVQDGWTDFEIRQGSKVIATYQKEPCGTAFSIPKGKDSAPISQKEFCEILDKAQKKAPLTYRTRGCC